MARGYAPGGQWHTVDAGRAGRADAAEVAQLVWVLAAGGLIDECCILFNF